MVKKLNIKLSYVWFLLLPLFFCLYFFATESDVPAPDFDLPLIGGDGTGRITLRQFQGQTVILNFWATWCHNCRREKKFIQQLQKNFRVVSILTLDPKVKPNTIQHLPVAFDQDGRVAALYGVSWLPQTFIIDTEQKIIHHEGQYLDVERYAAINEMLLTRTQY